MGSSAQSPRQNWLDQQTPYRVYWLLGTLLASFMLTRIQHPLGEQNLHALASQYTDTHVSPASLLQNWRHFQSGRWWWGFAEITFDTLLFLPLYLITLLVWCRFFIHQSLFVLNPYRPRVRQLMQAVGRLVVVGIWAGAIADAIENSLVLGWLFNVPGWLSANALWFVQFVKLGGVVGGIFYILLHPLGFVLAFRDAFYRLINPTRFQTENVDTNRQTFLQIIHEYRQAQRDVAAAQATSTQPTVPLTVWEFVKAVFRTFMNVQLVIYLLVLMLLVFTLSDQFDELFYMLITEPKRGSAVLGLTLLALGLWGGMVYVCTKILLFIQPNHFGEFDIRDPAGAAAGLKAIATQLRLLRNVPLWLAHAPFAIMLLTLWLNAYRLSKLDTGLRKLNVPGQTIDIQYRYWLITLLIIAGAILFSVIIRRLHRGLSGSDIVLFRSDTPDRDYALLLDQAPRSILYGQSVLVMALLLFVPTSPGLLLSQTVGLYAVVMIWLAVVAYLGTIILQFNDPFLDKFRQSDAIPSRTLTEQSASSLPRFPVVLLLVFLGFLFSFWNDNTAIRESPPSTEPNVPVALTRPTIDEYYQHWLQKRDAYDSTSTEKDTLPVVVIATAGGGIRAAAWTTEALQALNDQIFGFNHYLFAISGVSGGGVGAATYVAMLAGHPAAMSAVKGGSKTLASLRQPLLQVVTDDLISPTAASMLFRGGLHTFSPLAINALDRNRWLEDAWETRMLNEDIGLDSATKLKLPQSFLGFWPNRTNLRDSEANLPVLLLNGAVAETGQKVTMTPLSLGTTTSRTNPFYDVVDLFASTGHDVPYKTATFLCARFPFVTSGGRAVGTLPNSGTATSSSCYHVIDGGYAENTGILTAVQLIKRLQRVSKRLTIKKKIVYYLVFLANSETAEKKTSVTTFRFVNEPVNGLLKTWGRNSVALDQLIGYTLDRDALSFDYTSLTLDTDNHIYPLGWYISRGAVDKMTTQVQDSIRARLRIGATVLHRIRRQIERNVAAEK